MSRTEAYPVKLLLRMDEAMDTRVDEWRRKQNPIPNKNEALRQLIDAGLVAEGIA